VKGLAHQQTPDVPAASNFFQLLEISSNTGALQRLEALRGYSKLVSNREPNSLLADIKRQHTSARRAQARNLTVWIAALQLRIIE
jgi:hypothetical protein